jgi:hypothetical protein
VQSWKSRPSVVHAPHRGHFLSTSVNSSSCGWQNLEPGAASVSQPFGWQRLMVSALGGSLEVKILSCQLLLLDANGLT